MPLFARDLGAAAPAVGFVMGASTLTGAVVKLPAGALSDMLDRRLLLAGGLVFATSPFTYLAVSTLGMLLLLRFVHGSVFGTIYDTGDAVGLVIAGLLIALSAFASFRPKNDHRLQQSP